MLAIRFQRVGKRHQPSCRLVVVERRSKLSGPPIEYMGHYNPSTKDGEIDKERILYWLGIGAQPTLTVHNFLVRRGVIKGSKIPVPMKRDKGEDTGTSQAMSKDDGGSATPAPAPVDAERVRVSPANQENEPNIPGQTLSEPADETT